ncbi:MAG: RNA polymerase sigma-70 factor [Tannerella sp.]|jgi:RNA polymerase sigma-70 factor (ECF subfamily)|nr:RNA polymerase sigma-70 factor [Tannerella sp.]
MEESDYFCVKCLIEGDEDAFVALYHKYHRKIYHTALSMTRSEDLAQDVIQDVFLKVWENRTALDPGKSFIAYISVICRNVIFDMFKKASVEEAVRQKLQQFAEVSEPESEDDDFYETYISLLSNAIAKLPPQRSIIFKLCKLQKKSYDEVARSMNISRSTVQDHIVKANKAIREYLLTHVDLSFVMLFVILSRLAA